MQFSESLKKNEQFRFVYKNGRSYANKYFIMYVKENGLDKNRIGISVSKKVGNSVVRHRITRLVRESYRLHESVFNSGLDMVIIARPGAASIGYEEAESALLHLAKLHQYQTEQQLFQGKFEKYESVGCQTGNHDLCCNGNQTYNSGIQQITEKRYCFDHFQVILQCRSIR